MSSESKDGPSLFRQVKRLAKQPAIALRRRRANRRIFDSIINLRERPLEYHSVLLQRRIEEGEVVARLQLGDVIVAPGLVEKLGLQGDIDHLCRDHFNTSYQDLEKVHQLNSVETLVVGALGSRRSDECLKIQSSIMHRLLVPHSEEHYLELSPNLRLHLPYAAVKSKEQFIESRIGRGKLNPHGPHKDSWRFHPSNTINVWVSLTEANDQNGLWILPESIDYFPRFADQEVAPGVKTYPSCHYVTDLKKGDALLFCAELVHGSVLNRTKQTRVAFSMRCTLTRPHFHKRHIYNYIGFKNGRFTNLTLDKYLLPRSFEPRATDSAFPRFDQRDSGLRPKSVTDDEIIVEVQGETRRFPRRCGHLGADLTLGELNAEGQLICPYHRICYKGKRLD